MPCVKAMHGRNGLSTHIDEGYSRWDGYVLDLVITNAVNDFHQPPQGVSVGDDKHVVSAGNFAALHHSQHGPETSLSRRDDKEIH